MKVVRGWLTPEVGTVLRRALEAACDQAQAQDAANAELAPTFAQRQADAIGLLAECALAGGLDRGTAGDRYQMVAHVDAGALEEDKDVPAGPFDANVPDTESTNDGQYVPVGTPALAARCNPEAAHSQTVLDKAGGIHASVETARRLPCDAAVVTMKHGPWSAPLWVDSSGCED